MKTILLIGILLATVCGVSLSGASTNASVFPAHAAWQTSLQNGETLKACLRERLLGENDVVYQGWTPWDLAIWFKEEADGLSDERLHEALTAIYRESEAQSGKDARDLMIHVVLWLGVCADDATKTFLLKLAADTSKDGFFRTTALSSFLRNADAQEARDALLRFLVGKDRILSDMDRSEIYTYADTVWRESPPEKKLAICEALQVGLAHESTHWVFRTGDGWLCGLSPKYARSKERLAMLNQMYVKPAPNDSFWDRQSLAPQLEAARRLKTHTSVNTNLATAAARDFNKPLTEEDLADLAIPPMEPSATDKASQAKPLCTKRIGIFAIGGVTAFTLIVVGVWSFQKRRRKRPFHSPL